ncbi:hypothetical protein BC834DRAFT_274356 [Gloeopeniophorella convolvens]|nr:hypothetical protein BC834DRAFT_274356 [Gloeopeniophorella convolvens]
MPSDRSFHQIALNSNHHQPLSPTCHRHRTPYCSIMNGFQNPDAPPRAHQNHSTRQVDSDNAMAIEIASITQRTDAVQLAEPRSLVGPPHDSDAEMDLDDGAESSQTPERSRSARNSGLYELFRGIQKDGQDEDDGEWADVSAQMEGESESDSEDDDEDDEGLASGDEAVLAGRVKTTTPQVLTDEPRDALYEIFKSIGNPEDDPDDSEWLEGASRRAKTTTRCSAEMRRSSLPQRTW